MNRHMHPNQRKELSEIYLPFEYVKNNGNVPTTLSKL